MTASLVAQSYLDRIAAAVMQGDYDTYRQGVMLPFHMVTHTSNISVTTEAALRDGFDTFRQLLISQRITDYIRVVESAQQMDSDLISARYVTHLIAGSLRVIDPFHSQITLRQQGGDWRAVSITNALANSRWPLDVLRMTAPQGPAPSKGPSE